MIDRAVDKSTNCKKAASLSSPEDRLEETQLLETFHTLLISDLIYSTDYSIQYPCRCVILNICASSIYLYRNNE